MDTNCPGCGKRLRDIKAWEEHAKRCRKLKILRLSYNIPIVSLKDLPCLEIKRLPNGKDWGIWNINSNDWIRDKSGHIDSRLFRRNIKTLLNSLTAESIIADARKQPEDDMGDRIGIDEEQTSPRRDALLFLLILVLALLLIVLPIVLFGIFHK